MFVCWPLPQDYGSTVQLAQHISSIENHPQKSQRSITDKLTSVPEETQHQAEKAKQPTMLSIYQVILTVPSKGKNAQTITITARSNEILIVLSPIKQTMHRRVLQLADGIVHLSFGKYVSILAMTRDKRRRLAIQVSFIDVEPRHDTQKSQVGGTEND